MVRAFTLSLAAAVALLTFALTAPCPAETPATANPLVVAQEYPVPLPKATLAPGNNAIPYRVPEPLRRAGGHLFVTVDRGWIGPAGNYPASRFSHEPVRFWSEPLWFETLAERTLSAAGKGPADGFVMVHYGRAGEDIRSTHKTLWIAAADENEARARIEYVIERINEWFAEHGQDYIRELLEQSRNELAQARRELEGLQAEPRGRLGRGEPLSQAVKDEFQTQLLMLQLDIAGTEGRAEAARLARRNVEYDIHAARERALQPSANDERHPYPHPGLDVLTARRDELDQLLLDTGIDIHTMQVKSEHIREMLRADEELARLKPLLEQASEEVLYREAVVQSYEMMLGRTRLDWEDGVTGRICAPSPAPAPQP